MVGLLGSDCEKKDVKMNLFGAMMMVQYFTVTRLQMTEEELIWQTKNFSIYFWQNGFVLPAEIVSFLIPLKKEQYGMY